MTAVDSLNVICALAILASLIGLYATFKQLEYKEQINPYVVILLHITNIGWVVNFIRVIN